MRALRFLKPWSLYNTGEIAGFDDEQAEVLVSAGIAVDTDEAKKADKAAAKALAKQQAAEAKAQADAAAKAEAERLAAEQAAAEKAASEAGKA